MKAMASKAPAQKGSKVEGTGAARAPSGSTMSPGKERRRDEEKRDRPMEGSSKRRKTNLPEHLERRAVESQLRGGFFIHPPLGRAVVVCLYGAFTDRPEHLTSAIQRPNAPNPTFPNRKPSTHALCSRLGLHAWKESCPDENASQLGKGSSRNRSQVRDASELCESRNMRKSQERMAACFAGRRWKAAQGWGMAESPSRLNTWTQERLEVLISLPQQTRELLLIFYPQLLQLRNAAWLHSTSAAAGAFAHETSAYGGQPRNWRALRPPGPTPSPLRRPPPSRPGSRAAGGLVWAASGHPGHTRLQISPPPPNLEGAKIPELRDSGAGRGRLQTKHGHPEQQPKAKKSSASGPVQLAGLLASGPRRFCGRSVFNPCRGRPGAPAL
ncbi:hypothetical protein MPTK1_5g11150 [Marchantia polymorpha subsp. ruderalis]|uniref:Uncharacterized protein n=2 Tax=Marchantia polymorpha TaxID=3197 RepID=A0AAF6BH65_MARPO|nr:hypothetical protein MARPO_0093s0037 [Marchantia polymorpha]BBN11349.1 hypothetical protein Mp_5g11150 [Marchantia polymorpha subsp. ruderalis]|eukprot:PTQ32957.1 hypothetical protein MARPO_0093s0037 [Marchantia polymorpha]